MSANAAETSQNNPCSKIRFAFLRERRILWIRRGAQRSSFEPWVKVGVERRRMRDFATRSRERRIRRRVKGRVWMFMLCFSSDLTRVFRCV